MSVYLIFFFKQKTAYEMRISDWSSDVCSSDLTQPQHGHAIAGALRIGGGGACARVGLVADQEDLALGESGLPEQPHRRSEERRVGKECVSTCRYRWSPYH